MLALRLARITDTAFRTRRMTADDIRSRGEARLTDARERLARLETAAPRDANALVHAVDELQLALWNAASDLSVLVNVHPDLAARQTCEAIQVASTKLSTRVAQPRPFYDALPAGDASSLSATARRALELTLQDMRRAGVALDEASRTKAQQIRQRITELSQAYARNLRDDVRTVELPASAIADLPADYRAAHPAD